MRGRLLLIGVLLICALLLAAPLSAEEPEADAAAQVDTVQEAPEAYLTFDQTEVTLVKGKNVTIKPIAHGIKLPAKPKYTWSTSKMAVANVSEKGRIRANGGGSCKVWCSVTVDGISYTAECDVTVLVSVSGITAKDDSVILMPGERYTPVFKVKPDDVTDDRLELSSAEEEIVRVEGEELVAVSPGTCKVTASALDGSGKKKTITVRVATLRAETREPVISLRTGGEILLTYEGTVENYRRNITVTSKAKCFSVKSEYDEAGVHLVVTPTDTGTGTITVKDAKSTGTPLTLTVTIDNKLDAPTVTAVETVALAEGVFTVTLRNHGTEDISAFGIRYAFFDGEGEQIFSGKSGIVDYAGETVALDYMGTVPTGGVTVTRDMLPEACAGAVSMRAAVDAYTTSDGVKWAVPENSLRWVDSLAGEVDARGLAAEAVCLTAEESAAEDTDLTFGTVELPSGFAERYGFERVGRWVTLVTDGGRAEKAGLKQGDLIWAVDGVAWADDPFVLERAKAALAAGKSVQLQVERRGKTVKVTLK